jgi:3-dehydrotetronate 4-kinase
MRRRSSTIGSVDIRRQGFTEMSGPILGCIADDLTGATDLCNNLVRAGMRVMLTVDLPGQETAFNCDAVVVALKSRTIPAPSAMQQSRDACRWLRSNGAHQIYFKICSTFDSTVHGNIGPVAEALMDELGCTFCAVVPAFPDAGRTVYHCYLFVGDVLLSESGMRNHPLTPMTDSNLVRFLQLQLAAERKRKVGLIGYSPIAHSVTAIGERIGALRAQGVSIAIADTVSNDDLQNLAVALRDQPLVTAGSGLAMYLPGQWGFQPSRTSCQLPAPAGRKAIVSGSCSAATNGQVKHFIANGGKASFLDPIALAKNSGEEIRRALAWAASAWDNNPDQPLLIYSTADPKSVGATHTQLGVEWSGKLVEDALAAIARGVIELGVGQLIVAGGETAGVCVRALHSEQMQIGPQIDPGAPWCYASSPFSAHGHLHLALKSGNFGTPDFFTRAFTLL